MFFTADELIGFSMFIGVATIIAGFSLAVLLTINRVYELYGDPGIVVALILVGVLVSLVAATLEKLNTRVQGDDE